MNENTVQYRTSAQSLEDCTTLQQAAMKMLEIRAIAEANKLPLERILEGN